MGVWLFTIWDAFVFFWTNLRCFCWLINSVFFIHKVSDIGVTGAIFPRGVLIWITQENELLRVVKQSYGFIGCKKGIACKPRYFEEIKVRKLLYGLEWDELSCKRVGWILFEKGVSVVRVVVRG